MVDRLEISVPVGWVLHIDYIREMTAKKSCKYDRYGSFEHLLFFSSYYFFVTCFK